MKILLKLSFAIILFSFGCNQKNKNKNGLLSNLGEITNNEDKGIKEIIAFYGGQCEYGVTKNIYTGKENETDFWLKFSKSQTIDSLSNIAELSCSNIAYIFYKNLDKEKASYAHIQSELIFGNGENMKRNYTISELEKVKSKIGVVTKIIELLKSKDFNNLKHHLKIDTSLYKYDEAEMIKNVEQAEIHFGSPKQFTLYGFKYFKTDNGKQILHISGAIEREKNGSYFSVDLDPNVQADEIYSLNYDH